MLNYYAFTILFLGGSVPRIASPANFRDQPESGIAPKLLVRNGRYDDLPPRLNGPRVKYPVSYNATYAPFSAASGGGTQSNGVPLLLQWFETSSPPPHPRRTISMRFNYFSHPKLSKTWLSCASRHKQDILPAVHLPPPGYKILFLGNSVVRQVSATFTAALPDNEIVSWHMINLPRVEMEKRTHEMENDASGESPLFSKCPCWGEPNGRGGARYSCRLNESREIIPNLARRPFLCDGRTLTAGATGYCSDEVQAIRLRNGALIAQATNFQVHPLDFPVMIEHFFNTTLSSFNAIVANEGNKQTWQKKNCKNKVSLPSAKIAIRTSDVSPRRGLFGLSKQRSRRAGRTAIARQVRRTGKFKTAGATDETRVYPMEGLLRSLTSSSAGNGFQGSLLFMTRQNELWSADHAAWKAACHQHKVKYCQPAPVLSTLDPEVMLCGIPWIDNIHVAFPGPLIFLPKRIARVLWSGRKDDKTSIME